MGSVRGSDAGRVATPDAARVAAAHRRLRARAMARPPGQVASVGEEGRRVDRWRRAALCQRRAARRRCGRAGARGCGDGGRLDAGRAPDRTVVCHHRERGQLHPSARRQGGRRSTRAGARRVSSSANRQPDGRGERADARACSRRGRRRAAALIVAVRCAGADGLQQGPFVPRDRRVAGPARGYRTRGSNSTPSQRRTRGRSCEPAPPPSRSAGPSPAA